MQYLSSFYQMNLQLQQYIYVFKPNPQVSVKFYHSGECAKQDKAAYLSFCHLMYSTVSFYYFAK